MWTFPPSTCDLYNIYSSRTSRYYPTYINLAFSIYIYVYIYIYECTYIYTYYVYIYIYLYIYIWSFPWHPGPNTLANWSEFKRMMASLKVLGGTQSSKSEPRQRGTVCHVRCPGSELQWLIYNVKFHIPYIVPIIYIYIYYIIYIIIITIIIIYLYDLYM